MTGVGVIFLGEEDGMEENNEGVVSGGGENATCIRFALYLGMKE